MQTQVINKSFVLAALLILCSPASMAAKKVMDIVDRVIPPGAQGEIRLLEDVRLAIIHGCSVRGWKVKDQGEGVLIASIVVRGKHFAEVEVTFSERMYSITYVSSDNLDYNAKRHRIHRNYNNWIKLLGETIDRSFLGVN